MIWTDNGPFQKYYNLNESTPDLQQLICNIYIHRTTIVTSLIIIGLGITP